MDESIPTTDGRALKHGAPPDLPRILLVEDDAVSQAYLAAVLEALPATVEAVAAALAAPSVSPAHHAKSSAVAGPCPTM